jgi:hypothetical protein
VVLAGCNSKPGASHSEGPSGVTKSRATLPASPRITSDGDLLWNLEGLLRTTFGTSQPSSSDLTDTGPTNPADPPADSRTGPYLNFNCAGLDCAPPATYSPYRYTFSDPSQSTFHLSEQNYVGWSFGNYPVPVLIKGKIVACNRSETKFLIRYADASSFTLGCTAPISR